MHSQDIEIKVLALVRDWGGLPLDRIQRPNRGFNPPNDKIWARITVQHGTNMVACIVDKPTTRVLGAVVLQLFCPVANGTSEINRLADSFSTFAGYYRIEQLELLVPSIVDVGEYTGFYQLNVRIPFRYN